MIRLLHLHSAPADFETSRSLEQLRRGLGSSFDQAEWHISAGGEALHAAVAALNLWRQRRAWDLVHTWDIPSLLAAGFAGVKRIVHTVDTSLTSAALGWLRAVMNYRDVNVICPTATLRRRCIEHGIAPERCHIIRPGVDFSRIRRRRDTQLRQQFGFAPDDRVILLPGESTRPANHRLGLWTASILSAADMRYKALMWGRGAEVESLARFGRIVGPNLTLVVAQQHLGRDIEYEELLGAADLVLVTPEPQRPHVCRPTIPTLPIAIAMGAGLPIVSTVTYTTAELLEDRHTALMVAEPTLRALAQRVVDLVQDGAAQWTICDRARAEAYEYLPLTRFLSQYRTVYQQAAEGQPITLPDATPGIASRFHPSR